MVIREYRDEFGTHHFSLVFQENQMLYSSNQVYCQFKKKYRKLEIVQWKLIKSILLEFYFPQFYITVLLQYLFQSY